MSISSEIARIAGNVSSALTAISNKGVTVPSGSNSDDLATLIGQISGGGTPAISVVDTTDSHGGTIRTITALDISDTTAVAADVAQGKYFYTAAGVKTQGTASGGGATQHTIHLEFSDSTDTDIDVYYDDSLIGTMITSYEPSSWTYNNKTVVLAQLDNVTWYDKQSIPIGVQLIDYTKATNGYAVGDNGSPEAYEWTSISDYTPIDSTMTFTFIQMKWDNIGFYNSSKTVVRVTRANDIATSSSGDYATGTLSSSNIPASAAYVRLTGPLNPSSSTMSLIRTA